MSLRTGYLLLALLVAPIPSTALAITTQTASSMMLQWTAPGDDGVIGRAIRYDLRYSTKSLTTTNFGTARPAAGLPTPRVAGSRETYTLTGLSPDSTYFVAIKVADEKGNWSAMSKVAVRAAKALGVERDSLGLAFSEPWPNPARHTVNLAFRLPQTADVRVDVFDIAGRQIRSLTTAHPSSSPVNLVWDLRDDSGGAVAGGAYIVRARALEKSWTRRVVVIR